jgi:hypothetical protein
MFAGLIAALIGVNLSISAFTTMSNFEHGLLNILGLGFAGLLLKD